MAFLVFALPFGAQAKDTLTLRIMSDDGRIAFSYHGKRLGDAKLEQLCATAKRQKIDIEFQREKMTRDDALAAILKEAQCLGATHTGAMKIDLEPNSAPHKHARPRHRAEAPR